MSDLLRSVLDDLAPEPPAHLVPIEGTRRRAKVIRRRRALTAAASTLTAFALVLGVAALVARPATPRPADPVTPLPVSTYPDWRRRGDAPASVDREAIAAWDATLRAQGVRRHREPRVLFAGGDPLVVVLHGVAEVGGERLVVLTREPGKPFAIYTDVSAPVRGSRGMAVLLDQPRFTQSSTGCDVLSHARPARLLVLAEPGARRAEWWTRRLNPDACDVPDRTPAQPVALDGGYALTAVRGAWDAEIRAEVDGRYAEVVRATDDPEPYATRIDRSLAGPFSVPRADGSRAQSLLFDYIRVPGFDGGTGGGSWHAALPDGTRGSLTFANMKDGSRHAILLADDARGEVRLYLDVKRDPLPSAYTAIVDGYDGRWLLVVGHETLREAALVDGGVRTEIPLTLGWGAIRLDTEPSADARVWTPDFAPDGGSAIMSRSGTVLPER